MQAKFRRTNFLEEKSKVHKLKFAQLLQNTCPYSKSSSTAPWMLCKTYNRCPSGGSRIFKRRFLVLEKFSSELVEDQKKGVTNISKHRKKGCCIRPFLSQLVEVCYLKFILFGILVFWLTLRCPGICMISRVRSRLASILGLGPCHLLCCVLYSAFVMPLFDYCHVIWTPFAAKQTCMIEDFIKFLR